MNQPIVPQSTPLLVREEPRIIHLDQETLPQAKFVESALPLGRLTGIFLMSQSSAQTIAELASGCGACLHEIVQAACNGHAIEQAIERLLHPTLKDLRAHADIQIVRGYPGYASCILPFRETPHSTIPPRELLMILSTEAFGELTKKALKLGDRPDTFGELVRSAISRQGLTRAMMVDLVGEDALRERIALPTASPMASHRCRNGWGGKEHAAE